MPKLMFGSGPAISWPLENPRRRRAKLVHIPLLLCNRMPSVLTWMSNVCFEIPRELVVGDVPDYAEKYPNLRRAGVFASSTYQPPICELEGDHFDCKCSSGWQ